MNTDNSTETGANKKQFTDNQLRVFQVVLGVISAAALIISLYLPMLLKVPQGDLLNYVFVVVFLVIMFGRRAIENKYRLRLGLYSLALIIGIIAGIIFFVISMLNDPDATLLWSPQAKIMVLAGLIVLLLVAIIVPYIRYRKQKAEGTLKPIRLPEPKNEPKAEAEENTAAADDDGDGDYPMTIEQKIAAMTRELDKDKQEEEK